MTGEYDHEALAIAQAKARDLIDAWREATGPFVSPGVPDDMVHQTPDPLFDDPSSGWRPWEPVPTRVSLDDVAALNAQLPEPLPLSFVAFLTSYALLTLDFGDYTLPGLPTTNPLGEVRRYVLNPELFAAGFVQVGSARGCGDPVALDLRCRDSAGECPVVLFNHDFLSGVDVSDRTALLPYAAELRPSFLDFLSGIIEGDDDLFPPPLSIAERYAAAKRRHEFVRVYNWDDGLAPIGRLVDDPATDHGTALMIYWLLEGPWLTNEGVSAAAYRLALDVEAKLVSGHYGTHWIHFDPVAELGLSRVQQHKLLGAGLRRELLHPPPPRDAV